MKLLVFPVLLSLSVAAAFGSDQFATQWVSYNQGIGPVPTFTNPLAAVGEPTRYTGVGVFPSAVTPFNPPFLNSEVVSIGQGGSLTLGFDHPVVNDPLNPFGIDLLIFGNAFYADSSHPEGIAAGVISAGGGVVEVSADGDTWKLVTGAVADGQFPTLGYSDLTDPYALDPGSVLSDFTRPVNPAFNAIGKNFAQIVAGYNGSGGGSGIDFAPTGLNSILFVRITNPAGSGVTVEVDAVSDVVPAPGTTLILACVAGALGHRRRR